MVSFQRPDRVDNDEDKPGTFDCLGFTHHWAVSRKGNWIVKQRTAKDRFGRALRRLRTWCRWNRHDPVEEHRDQVLGDRPVRLVRPGLGQRDDLGDSPCHRDLCRRNIAIELDRTGRCCQTCEKAVTMMGMLIGVLRALPETEDGTPSSCPWPAFREYRLLAGSAFMFHFSVWADKGMLWLLAGKAQAMIYASAAALAWFSVIPAFAWIYVEVETVFYRKFRDFYGALEGGGGLDELEINTGQLRRETARLLRGAAAIQIMISVLVLAANDYLVRAIGLPPEAILPFRLVALGAAPQVVTLLGMLLLY
ncbi:MAG TPA: exopolysaccharide Pel transporter PelG [Kofleriaceae bacterium]|jgi:hypothetical protein|nr:exopolysaccharide Pel transporter PelG [Kofleriaceae bacterium]